MTKLRCTRCACTLLCDDKKMRDRWIMSQCAACRKGLMLESSPPNAQQGLVKGVNLRLADVTVGDLPCHRSRKREYNALRLVAHIQHEFEELKHALADDTGKEIL